MNASSKRLFTEPLFTGLEIILEIAGQTEAGQVLPTPRIASELGLSVSYVEKIARDLSRAALIKAERGVKGGFRLTRRPEEISIADIADAVDVRPANKDVTGSRAYAQNLRRQLVGYNRHVLAKISIAEVMKTGMSDYKIFRT